jgi:hypothetical protein
MTAKNMGEKKGNILQSARILGQGFFDGLSDFSATLKED